MKDLKLISKIARSFHATTGIDYAELFSEASLAYCEAKRSFDVEKGYAFSTYAWKVINHSLVNFIRSEKKVPLPFSKVSATIPDTIVTFQPEIDEFYETLNPLCKELVSVILNHLEEIPEDLIPRLARGKIFTILRKEGWSRPKIWNGIREMKLAVS
jgi:RNA polymerase sigma factor (sigma-70 family)